MIETIHWHTLHPRYLDQTSKVLDLGANCGLFAEAITERFGCRCIAVEPSPAAFNTITETGLISKMQVAVTDKSGTMPFHIASETAASSLLYKAQSYTDTIRVRALSLPELIKELNWPR
jgi:FkbM family methyltransferase